MPDARLRIVIVDDNPDDRALAARTISGEFPTAEIVQVGTADAFTELLEQGGFDAVVTDYQLRWGTGLRVLRESKARYPQVPVVMFTGTGTEEIAAEGFRHGLDDYVIKTPSHYLRLAVALRAALERAEFRRQQQQTMDELRRAKEQAEHANRLKDEFLATVSHELRTPLNAILGWADLLRHTGGGDEPDPEDLRQGLDVIERNARAQARLVEDLLDVSRIVSGRMRLDLQRTDLAAVVDAALDSVRPAAEAKQIRLQTALDPALPPVLGDSGRLQQVVWNLLSNAVKFTPAGGWVRVSLERIDGDAEIAVSDNGLGIAPGDLPLVFERFRQVDQSTTRRHGGLGLGLTIVRHLAEMHGGRVHVKSPGEGLGSTFFVTLPLAVPPPVTVPPPTSEPVAELVRDVPGYPSPDIAGVRVLVVDDEPDARMLMARILREVEAESEVAGSAEEAMRRIEAARPDILVSDIGMPGEDGYSLIRRLRHLEQSADPPLPPLPAVALTAYARAEDRRRATMAGFQVHLPKPVDTGELIAVIANLTGRRPS